MSAGDWAVDVGRPVRIDGQSGAGGEGEEEIMNRTRFPYLIMCPECGRAIHAESAAMLGADYWQHLAKEHGMSRQISARHDRPGISPGHRGHGAGWRPPQRDAIGTHRLDHLHARYRASLTAGPS